MGEIVKPESIHAIRWYALQRKLMWAFLARKLGAYLVAEYPKSGGTWYSQMLSEYLELPFARNTSKPHFTQCVMHGHELYKGYDDRVSVVLRDGRDLMVSFYYHHLFYNDWNHHPSVDKHRAQIGFDDFDDIYANLPKFIVYMNEVWGRRFNHFTWAQFIESWLPNVPAERLIKYEDLLASPLSTMERALKSLTGREVDTIKLEAIVEKYRFENVAGRKQGAEKKSSFLRKGVAGDWVNHYSQESREVFDRYFGDALIRCGYEKDGSWASK